jgi:hypothetical protein
MENKVLNNFGEILMTQVRDRAIARYRMIANGSVKAPSLKALSHRLTSLTDEELSSVEDVIIETVDSVIFNLLNTLEEEDKLQLLYQDKENILHNIVDLSDGLAGELFTEDGWIYQFSKYKSKGVYH